MTSRRILLPLLCSAWLALPAAAQNDGGVAVNDENPDGLPVLTQVEKPFAFIYGTWDNDAKIENGVARLHCRNSKGAAGMPENMSAAPEQRPLMRVTVGPENKAKILKLILRDGASNTGVWEYDLSTVPRNTPTLIRPIGNVSLSSLNCIDKKDGKPGEAPDVTKLTQWKLCGDWSDDRLDVDVAVILLE